MLGGVNSWAFTKTMACHTSKKVCNLYFRVTIHAVYERENRLSGQTLTQRIAAMLYFENFKDNLLHTSAKSFYV